MRTILPVYQRYIGMCTSEIIYVAKSHYAHSHQIRLLPLISQSFIITQPSLCIHIVVSHFLTIQHTSVVEIQHNKLILISANH